MIFIKYLLIALQLRMKISGGIRSKNNCTISKLVLPLIQLANKLTIYNKYDSYITIADFKGQQTWQECA